MSNKSLPLGWQEMTFSEMAEQISERVDDPQKAGVDIYVGLEHLDPGDLRIRRRGTPADVEATKLRIRPGQIIFGKRRAYQRKVAVADFDGICSAHAMILQERSVLAPGFLPFFMQSDAFMDRAVTISEGGLSPTIKWKTLAAQKFVVPPFENQCVLVEIMRGFEAAIEAGEEIIAASQRVFSVLVDEEFQAAPEAIPFTDLCELRNGLNFSGDQRGSEGIKVIDINAIPTVGIYPDKENLYSVKLEASPKDLLQSGDLLIIRSHANKQRVGTVVIVDTIDNNTSFSGFIIRARPDSARVNPRYLTYFMRSAVARRQIVKGSGGTNINNINRTTLSSVLVPIYSPAVQIEIVNRIDTVAAQVHEASNHLSRLRSFKMIVLNENLHSLSVAEGNPEMLA